MRDEESDLSFAEFGSASPNGSIRLWMISGDKSESSNPLNQTGTPGGIRTPDPQVRSLMLYPAELPARAKPQGTQMRAACRGRGRAAEAVSVGLGCFAS